MEPCQSRQQTSAVQLQGASHAGRAAHLSLPLPELLLRKGDMNSFASPELRRGRSDAWLLRGVLGSVSSGSSGTCWLVAADWGVMSSAESAIGPGCSPSPLLSVLPGPGMVWGAKPGLPSGTLPCRGLPSESGTAFVPAQRIMHVALALLQPRFTRQIPPGG